MAMFYRTLEERTPDTQYQDRLWHILDDGRLEKETPQDVGALTCFGELAPMVFPVQNGAPVITERKIPWKAGVGEILAFINGARDLDTLKEFGVTWWGKWASERKCTKIGVPVGDLGPGSYGAAFHDFPMPDGQGFNQLAHAVEQLQNPENYKRRTIFVHPWIPFYNGWGSELQKAVVSPCHGWMHFRVLNGKLYLHMFQRSADMPIGVPFNMVQYFALLLAVAQVTGLEPAQYSHSFSDAHIYADQVEEVRTVLSRVPRPFPILKVDPGVKNLFDFRPHHFELEEYDPHPGLEIPVAI
ncbi:MAG: thymidylate synthase [Candidatus Pacebacteria bacterium]|nr:thymidylate synthase [Candidatus Paceibacterota bacterium]